MQDVVFIHGAEAFSRYDDYLQWLRTTEVNPFAERAKRWKDVVPEQLGDEYRWIAPSMPNKQNAKYAEWKIWFERHIPFLEGEPILIGNSQGGYFLSKYLTENALPMRARAVLLLAAPFESDAFAGHVGADGGDFAFNTNKIAHLEAQTDHVFIFHCRDDSVVPFAHAEKYKAALPNAELIALEGCDHMFQEEFPELVDKIKSL